MTTKAFDNRHTQYTHHGNNNNNYCDYSAIKIGILCRVVSSLSEFAIFSFFFCVSLLFPRFAVRTHWIYHRWTTTFFFLLLGMLSLRIAFAFPTKSTGNKTIRAVIHFMICVRCFSNCSHRPFRLFRYRNSHTASQLSHSNATVSLLVLILLFCFPLFAQQRWYIHEYEYKSLTSNINQMKYVCIRNDNSIGIDITEPSQMSCARNWIAEQTIQIDR